MLSYASCAEHSDLEVGFESANIIGRLLIVAMCLRILGVNAFADVEHPK